MKYDSFQVCFEFVSSTLGHVESFWNFLIPELNIAVPFLLVGHTQDPSITLDRSHLNFKSLLIGKYLITFCGVVLPGHHLQ